MGGISLSGDAEIPQRVEALPGTQKQLGHASANRLDALIWSEHVVGTGVRLRDRENQRGPQGEHNPHDHEERQAVSETWV
jgi:hypothetical protein